MTKIIQRRGRRMPKKVGSRFRSVTQKCNQGRSWLRSFTQKCNRDRFPVTQKPNQGRFSVTKK